jgi:phosphoglycerate dehydrogenase-like enzyme
LGSIGLETSKRAAALEMNVIAVRQQPKRTSDAPVKRIFDTSGLDEMLQASDHVVLAAPLTERTRGLMNRDHLRQMKPDAYLINVSRGALVDEPALVEALEQRRIGGAALDVFEKEPLPPESPLWKTANVLITPTPPHSPRKFGNGIPR